MQVSITGRHMELTDALKQYTNDKIQHLDHSFDHVVDVHVVLSVEKIRQCAEVSIQANGINIHASVESDDMYASIDGVIDKLNRQLKRYRSKLNRHQKHHSQKSGREIPISYRIMSSDDGSAHEELAEDHLPDVLHHENKHTKPMSIDEAVMQLDLASNQPVLIFTNQETDSLNVLYRRHDGKFGWVEPGI
ncbi:MAG: ribosome-associated translation inhibitor RaiA [Mariprofundaceae bacterium]